MKHHATCRQVAFRSSEQGECQEEERIRKIRRKNIPLGGSIAERGLVYLNKRNGLSIPVLQKGSTMSSKKFLTEFLTPIFIAADAQIKKQPVTDTYHGIEVADPYRWLEDLDSAETRAWMSQQNRATAAYFEALPELPHIREAVTTRWDYPGYSLPMKRGQRSFFWYNSGLQPQSVLLMQEGAQTEPRLILDPNTLSQDGTIAVHTTSVNEDGTLLVYGLSTSGSDWQELHIRQIDEESDYPEVLRWTRHSTVAWRPDSRGFFYSRYPEPGTVAPEDE